MAEFPTYDDATTGTYSAPRDLLPGATAVVLNNAVTNELAMATLLQFIEQGGRVVRPTDVSPGIEEDGTGDQTTELNAWLATAAPGVALVMPPGAKYRHSGVLTITSKTRPRLVGYGAELIASAQATSALKIMSCTSPRLYGVSHSMETLPTSRGSTEDHHLIYVKDCTDLHAKHTHTRDSHAAGFLMENVNGFLIENPTQEGGRADGLHMNAGCRHGRVYHPTSIGVGDDGVAIVSAISAGGDATLCQNVRVYNAKVRCFPNAVELGAGSGTGGRGLTIVGARDCHYIGGEVLDSWAAGLLVGTEGGYTSHSVDNCSMKGIIVELANRGAGIPHGSILVSSDRSGFHVNDVTIESCQVIDPNLSGSWGGAVRVINGAGAGGTMDNITIGRAGRPIIIRGYYNTGASGAINIDPGVAAEVTSNFEYATYAVPIASSFEVITDDTFARPNVGAVYWKDTSTPAAIAAGDLFFDTDAP